MTLMDKVVQLSGKGKEGLEDCPTFYHFDIENDEFLRFLADPKPILDRIGMKAPLTIVLPSWEGLQGGVEGLQGQPTQRTKVCCTTGDGGMTCTAGNK
jgi:hypothetical protein